MKLLIFYFLIGLVLFSSASADCLPIDADTLVPGAELSSHMQGVRIQKTVEPPAEIRLIITQTDSGTVILDKAYSEQSSAFDSGEIYLPYTGRAATAYTVSLQTGGEALSFSYTQLQARLTDNSAYTLGPRLSGDWPMATVLDLTRTGATVPICASNQYIIGQAVFTLSGGTLEVSLSFAASANVTLENQAVYVTLNPASLDDNPLRQAKHSVGEAIDISGGQTALVCVPLTVSYDPVGLSDFVYNANDREILSQMALLK